MKGIVLKVKSPKSFHRRKNDISYFFKRYGLFSMFLLTILIGMVLGIYFGVRMNSGTRLSFDFLFQTDFQGRGQQDFISLFCTQFSPLFLFFVAVFLLGFCPWGNVLLPVLTIFKGFGAGLTLSQLCCEYGMKGFGFFMLAVIPGFFLFSSAIAFLGEQSFRLSADVFGLVIRKRDKVLALRDYAVKSAVYLVVAFAAALMDTVMFTALYTRFGI